MKTAIAVLFLTLTCSASFAKDVRVDGYTKKDGTYVEPHHRTSPDKSKDNNYGSSGNYNPYTGKVGTDSSSSQDYSQPKRERSTGLNY